MKNKKLRIALVNQRYGLEVNGGSEYYTRQLAEHLNVLYNVEVLTTRALGYDTWEDYYPDEKEIIHGIPVRRFHVAKLRNVFRMKVFGKLQQYCPVFRTLWEERWIDAQGPYSPDLIRYIKRHGKEYQAILFVTYLYYPTVRGLPQAADRGILIPTAHDEPYIYFRIFRHLFSLPKGIIYLTPEEKRFVESMFPVSDTRNCVCGSGVELPEQINDETFRKKYSLYSEYLIYVGRIDQSKGCDEMFRIFRAFKDRHRESDLKLVLMGKAMMDIPQDEDIISLGFVSEEDKFNGISGARALWLPSRYESLSIAVLESLASGVPVMVNGNCEVLKGHCDRSGAGAYYYNKEEVLYVLDSLMAADRSEIGEKAKQYIKDYYQWDTIIGRVDQLIKEIINEQKDNGE